MISDEEWYTKVCRSYKNPPVFLDDQKLPGFPSDTIQINTTGQAGPATLREAFVFYTDCARAFAEDRTPLGRNARLLDFGVGWGRISRFFLRDVPQDNIHGIDATEEFVDICRETFGSGNFHVTTPFPPTHIPSASITHIVGYSVFSHLSEEACAAWMKEFHRILVPGGVVALTTRGRTFFDFCESLRGKRQEGYLGALATTFDDFADARRRYDRGEFVHSNAEGVTGGGAMSSEFYGETFIPQAYAAKAYGPGFQLFKFQPEEPRQPSRFRFWKRRKADPRPHPIMFFKKI